LGVWPHPPTPKTPIPNPQSPIPNIFIKFLTFNKFFISKTKILIFEKRIKIIL